MALMGADGHTNSAESWSSTVWDLLGRNAYQEAWEVCRRAIAQYPDAPELLVAAGAVLMKLDRAVEAEQYVARAAALQPESPVIWNNLGLSLRNQNRVAESLQCFEKALSLDPGWARAHYDRAFALLLSGDYRQGFSEYEHRWEANGVERPGDSDPAMRERLWRGEDPRNKRVLLYAEQGLGDTIQFLRYVASVKARGAEVVLEVQPALRELARRLSPGCEVRDGDAAATAFDLHCPLMTLPLIFGTTPETIPPPAVFSIQQELQQKWRARIPVREARNVGLVWAGNPENPMDDRRSTQLRTFERLLSQPKVRFFSFQTGSRVAEIEDERYRELIEDLSSELNAAIDTAAALMQMDLVITVDTFVAHLAATLGVPVWLLLPFAPDWRWLLDREDSPWYASIRLFRQSTAGDWAGVAERVRKALRYCDRR